MADIIAGYSPVAIFLHESFAGLYKDLAASLGYEPNIKTIGMMTRDEADVVRALIERKDWNRLAELADGRNPHPYNTSLGLQVPGCGTLYFGKILVDGLPKAIALQPIGTLSRQASATSLPESITSKSSVRALRNEPVQWLDLDDLAEKYGHHIERRLSEYTGAQTWHSAELAFLGILDGVFKQLEACNRPEYDKLFAKRDLVIGDIGCGIATYGKMLVHYFSKHGKKVVFVGVDPDTDMLNGNRVISVGIPYRLEDSEPHLREKGIEGFDLITMFNPRDVIDIGGLPESFRRNALVLVALDTYEGLPFESNSAGASSDDVIDNLAANQYMILTENRNPYVDEIVFAFGHKYNPVMVARPIGELLRNS